MIHRKFQKAIAKVHDIFSSTRIPWAVIGSSNLALQGVPVEPNDLDIVVPYDDLQKIPKLFGAFNPSPISDLAVRTGETAWNITFKIHGVFVEIMGETDAGLYVSKLRAGRTTTVVVNELIIPVLTLDAEADAYAETGREGKAEMITGFISEQQILGKDFEHA